MIKFLLKNKGYDNLWCKKLLNLNINKLDDYNSHSLKAEYYKNNLKNKSKNIIKQNKNLKKYGKKNSSKS